MLYAAEEIRICLISLYCGTLIGLTYDVFECLQLVLKRGGFLSALLDVLFYIVAGILAALMLLYSNEGRIRLYSLIILAAGIMLYCRFPMRLVGSRIRRHMAKKLRHGTIGRRGTKKEK